MSSSGYRPQSVSEVLARGIVALAKYIESPRTDAQLLLSSVLGRDRAPDRPVIESWNDDAHVRALD